MIKIGIPIKIIAGERFGRLTFIEERPKKSNRRRGFFTCDWAHISGVPEESISSRLRMGWKEYEAVFTPIKGDRKQYSLIVNTGDRR